MNLLILLLIALPMCLAEFTIQGPTDGNRQAQGLRVSEEKGIQYTENRDSIDDGSFTIQGATDGNSNFNIQGASDGHSDFQIQGPSDGGADKYNFQAPTVGATNYQSPTTGGVNFHIQGATDSHSQSVIQGPYDPNQGGGKSLEYNDPSGLRVNWRSYDRQPSAPQPQQQYAEAPAPVRGHRHRQQHAAPAAPQPVQQSRPVYRSYDSAPPQIKQLLQYQAQIPYLNSIPEPFRYDFLASSQAQGQQGQYQHAAPEAPAERPPVYRGKSRGQSRPRRQAPQHHGQGAQQPQYRRVQGPPQDPQYQYSPNVPPKLQNLVQYQKNIPYINVIPEQYRFDEEAAIQAQREQVRALYENLARNPSPPPTPAPAPAPHRSKRQAQHPQGGPQQQYRRVARPPAEPQPHYSTQIPGHLKQLLNYQAEIPYNIIANQIVYRPEKPYVPQPVEPPVPAQYQSQTQYQGQSQYQGQAEGHQGQTSAQSQSYLVRQPAQAPQYPAYPQGQPGYGQSSGVHPVTENQY